MLFRIIGGPHPPWGRNLRGRGLPARLGATLAARHSARSRRRNFVLLGRGGLPSLSLTREPRMVVAISTIASRASAVSRRQRRTTSRRSGSRSRGPARTAPDSAPPRMRTSHFLGRNVGVSNPVLPTGPETDSGVIPEEPAATRVVAAGSVVSCDAMLSGADACGPAIRVAPRWTPLLRVAVFQPPSTASVWHRNLSTQEGHPGRGCSSGPASKPPDQIRGHFCIQSLCFSESYRGGARCHPAPMSALTLPPAKAARTLGPTTSFARLEKGSHGCFE